MTGRIQGNDGMLHTLCVSVTKGNVSTVRKVDAEELEVAIQNRDRPMVVDFYATWCGPCVLMSSELEKVRSTSCFYNVVKIGRLILFIWKIT